MNAKMKRVKAIIGIAMTVIMLASVFTAIVPLASAQPTGAKREADGSIISGNTLFTGEHWLHFDAAYSDAVSLKKVEDGDVIETITIADPFDFCIPHSVEEGGYEIRNATDACIGYLTIKEPEITGDVFIEGTMDSIVGKSIPLGTKITIRARPNFGGLMNASDGSGWSKIKIKLFDPDGIEMKKVVDADSSEIDITPDDWSVLDTSDWDVGAYKVKITSDITSCNEVDVRSPYYEFTVRSYELSIEAAEDTVCRGESIILMVSGYPRYYYYLIVTNVDVTAPPAIEDTYDVKALDTAGDAYPATATPNLAAWIKTGSDGIADVKISTTGADERTYTIKVYDTTTPAYPDFVPDYAVVPEDDDEVDVKVVKPVVVFDMPSSVVIGETVTIKGAVSAGDEVDIVIEDANLVFDDVSVDENNEFEVKWDTSGLTIGFYWIDVYIDCEVDTEDPEDYEDIDEDGSTIIWLAAPGLTAEQPRNEVAEGDAYTIEGIATGTDDVDIVLVGPEGYPAADPGLGVLNGLEIMSSSVTDDEFSEEIEMTEGLDLGTWKTMVFSPGRDAEYGDLGIGAGELDWIPTDWFAGKSQDQIVTLLKDHTVNVAGSDDLLVELTFEVETPYVRFEPIESVTIGEPLEITGTTNREPGTVIAIWTIEGPAELPPVVIGVEWPTADQGVFTATIDTTDAVLGTYTLKAEDADGHSDTTTVEIVAGKPSISISTDKYSYRVGDTMYLGLNVANPLDSPQDIGIDIWLEMPTYPWTYTLMHKPSITLPAGLEYTNPSFATFVLPDISSGTYTWHSQLSDPVTSDIISSDTAVWTFNGHGAERDIAEVLETVTVDVESVGCNIIEVVELPG